MKKIILLLLIFGMVFSAGSFPNEITGTELKLVEKYGTVENGEAYYETDYGDYSLYVVAEKISASDWAYQEEGYKEYEWESTTQGGTTYYYYCTPDYYGNYCYVDYYINGIWFMTDVYGEDNESQVVSVAIKAGQQFAGGAINFDCCASSMGMIGILLGSLFFARN